MPFWHDFKNLFKNLFSIFRKEKIDPASIPEEAYCAHCCRTCPKDMTARIAFTGIEATVAQFGSAPRPYPRPMKFFISLCIVCQTEGPQLGRVEIHDSVPEFYWKDADGNEYTCAEIPGNGH